MITRFEDEPPLDQVLPVIEEGDPSPTDADYQEAARLEAALRQRDPRVVIESHDGAWRVYWRSLVH